MNKNVNSGLTVTFSECVENHVGNQQIGQLSPSGFKFQELHEINERLQNQGIVSQLVNLGDYLPPEYGSVNAGVLVIRDGINIFVNLANLLWDELKDLPYDKHALMYGQVRNKNARHNLCFGLQDQTADYSTGKGTVVGYHHLPYLSHVRKYLPTLLNERASDLLAEANYYYDLGKCGINFHGDSERKIVIGLRLGGDFPL
jgi:hypothetical protein